MTASPKPASRSGSGSKRAQSANGPKVGKYTLAQQLGKGGYGEVHVGVPKAGARVAIKLLDASLTRDAEAVARFKREAETGTHRVVSARHPGRRERGAARSVLWPGIGRVQGPP
jgi:serine/threonine protein kinase